MARFHTISLKDFTDYKPVVLLACCTARNKKLDAHISFRVDATTQVVFILTSQDVEPREFYHLPTAIEEYNNA